MPRQNEGAASSRLGRYGVPYVYPDKTRTLKMNGRGIEDEEWCEVRGLMSQMLLY